MAFTPVITKWNTRTKANGTQMSLSLQQCEDNDNFLLDSINQSKDKFLISETDLVPGFADDKILVDDQIISKEILTDELGGKHLKLKGTIETDADTLSGAGWGSSPLHVISSPIIKQTAVNKTLNDLTKGTAVVLHDSSGERIAMDLLVASEISSEQIIIAILNENIAKNTEGKVIRNGPMIMDTTSWEQNDVLYASTTPGVLTNVPPAKGFSLIPVGIVVKKAGPTDGIVFVNPFPIARLSQLPDVNVSTVVDGNTLVYQASTGLWIPGSTLDDHKVLVSASDTTPGFLFDKVESTTITLDLSIDGTGNEILDMNVKDTASGYPLSFEPFFPFASLQDIGVNMYTGIASIALTRGFTFCAPRSMMVRALGIYIIGEPSPSDSLNIQLAIRNTSTGAVTTTADLTVNTTNFPNINSGNVYSIDLLTPITLIGSALYTVYLCLKTNNAANLSTITGINFAEINGRLASSPQIASGIYAQYSSQNYTGYTDVAYSDIGYRPYIVIQE